MSLHFPLDFIIGGTLPESKREEFEEIFRESAHLGERESDEKLEDFVQADHLCHNDEDCSPYHYDPLFKYCRENGLAYISNVWSDGVYGPDVSFWLLGMKSAVCIPLTMDGEAFVTKEELKKMLEAYHVSEAEFRRAVRDLVPPDIPKLPPFKIEED